MLLPYYSGAPFKEFETLDAIIIDLLLAADGTFYIKINTSDPGDLGSYELFAYRGAAAAVPEPSAFVLGAIALLGFVALGWRRTR